LLIVVVPSNFLLASSTALARLMASSS